MLDHMTFRVSDITRTKAFYTPLLGALGYGLPDANAGHGYAIDTGFVDGPSPYGGHAVTTGCHLPT